MNRKLFPKSLGILSFCAAQGSRQRGNLGLDDALMMYSVQFRGRLRSSDNFDIDLESGIICGLQCAGNSLGVDRPWPEAADGARMNMVSRIGLVLGLLVSAGCQAPWIQGPNLAPRDPRAEIASFTQHDLLPDSSLGPDTGGRPREALTQRSEPRRTMEAAMPAMTGRSYVPGSAPQVMPPPASSYPNTISP